MRYRPMAMDQWWKQTGHACTDEYRYTELLLSDGPGTKQERERMAKACLACPVYLDCLDDVIAAGQAWEFLEETAGLNG